MNAARAEDVTLDEVMAQALAIEHKAVERYYALADVMEVHNNRKVCELFRKMAKIEAEHAHLIMAEMGWKSVPAVPAHLWSKDEGPESVPEDKIHYLMWPWHALQLALAAEQRAAAFFAQLVERVSNETVRSAVRKLHKEECEHVALVQAWLDKTPQPGDDWADDPDPPRYTD